MLAAKLKVRFAMRIRAFLLAALAAFPTGATAQSHDSAATAPARDIVVTGVRLKDSEAALAACLARKCPPDQDINATIAHAENQFIAGDYKAARRTLHGGIGRNWRYAHDYPVLVADLVRANSRVAGHLGETDDRLFSANAVVRALKAGLPDTDYRVLVARIEVGDDYAKSRRVDEALGVYKDAASRAHKLGLPVIEGYARLHMVVLLQILAENHDHGYEQDARHALDALIAETDPHMAAFAFAGRVLKAQAAARRGDDGAIDRLIADYRRVVGGSARPMLLFSPPIGFNPALGARANAGGSTLNQMAMDNFEDQWVDISYLITPDGHVADADVLRQSRKLAGHWPDLVLAAIRARRYAPLAADADQAGMLRIERYTYTSPWVWATGSHMRKREGTPDIEMLDLTVDPPGTGPTAGK